MFKNNMLELHWNITWPQGFNNKFMSSIYETKNDNLITIYFLFCYLWLVCLASTMLMIAQKKMFLSKNLTCFSWLLKSILLVNSGGLGPKSLCDKRFYNGPITEITKEKPRERPYDAAIFFSKCILFLFRNW
jgi:hypothetical protein